MRTLLGKSAVRRTQGLCVAVNYSFRSFVRLLFACPLAICFTPFEPFPATVTKAQLVID